MALPARFTSKASALFAQIRPLVSKPTLSPYTHCLQTANYSHNGTASVQETPSTTSIVKDTKRLIEFSRKVQDTIVAGVKPDDASFKKVLSPMAVDENTMSLESRTLGFYQFVSASQDLRNASTESQNLFDDFSIEASMREDVFKLVEGTLQKGEKLDAESQRLLEKKHKSYIRNGLGLPAGPDRERLKEIKKRLSQISIIFQKNINEENGGIWFTPKELDGTPHDVVAGLAKGEGKDEGKLRLSFKYPDYFPVLKCATNAATRKCILMKRIS